MDRRQKKSQVALKQALLELIREKEFQSITVANITERADLNRGTFYLHYEDKFHMIDQIEMEVIDELKTIILDEMDGLTSLEALIRSRYEVFIHMFECFNRHHDSLEIILNTKGILSLQNHLKEFLNQIITTETRLIDKISENIPIELFRLLMVSICLGLVQYTMENNGELDSEEFTVGMLNIIINGPARAAGLIPTGKIDISEIIGKR